MRVFDADVAGFDRPELGPGETHHITQVRGLEAAHACAAGAPGERVQQALAAGEPILKPQGRRLGGGEIRAAFAGRRMAGILWSQWGVRAAVSASWDPGGERQQFHPARPERRIATQRWWVEGDRLCAADEGCNAVLADGRFLHVVGGEPPRFLATFAAAPPGG